MVILVVLGVYIGYWGYFSYFIRVSVKFGFGEWR